MATQTLTYQDVQKEMEEIPRLVDNVNSAALNLKSTAEKCIKMGIQTQWAGTLYTNLEQYYDADIVDAMNDIKKQSAKLEEILQATKAFSNETDSQ